MNMLPIGLRQAGECDGVLLVGVTIRRVGGVGLHELAQCTPQERIHTVGREGRQYPPSHTHHHLERTT